MKRTPINRVIIITFQSGEHWLQVSALVLAYSFPPEGIKSKKFICICKNIDTLDRKVMLQKVSQFFDDFS